jgi:hypothetical protein
MIIQSAKQICGDDSYTKIQELVVKEDGANSKLTCKYEILKEYPQDMIVSTIQVVD